MTKLGMATLALGALTVVLTAGPVAAAHCNGVITVIPAGPATLYLDDRTTATGQINHWLYLESNGVAGLQSGGCAVWDVTGSIDCDPCDHANPDTLLL